MMEKGQKQELIYESFDALKDSWKDKFESIARLICKMWSIDENAAIEMWLYILNKNKKLLSDRSELHAGILIEDMLSNLFYGINTNAFIEDYNNDNERKIADIVFSNKELYTLIYGLNYDVDINCSWLLSHLIASEDSTTLQIVLNLLVSNIKDTSIGRILTIAIDHIEASVPQQNIELLENFVSTITNKVERAEAFTALLSLDK